MLKVLLIEGDSHLAQDLLEELHLAGCSATWLSALDVVSHHNIHGIDSLGRKVCLGVQSFDLAMIGRDSPRSLRESWRNVAPLTDAGVACIGISDDGSTNQGMEWDGACCSASAWSVQSRYGEEGTARLNNLLKKAESWLAEVRPGLAACY